jgi:hypothetical protein
MGHSSSGMDKYWTNRIKNQGVGCAEGLSGGTFLPLSIFQKFQYKAIQAYLCSTVSRSWPLISFGLETLWNSPF